MNGISIGVLGNAALSNPQALVPTLIAEGALDAYELESLITVLEKVGERSRLEALDVGILSSVLEESRGALRDKDLKRAALGLVAAVHALTLRPISADQFHRITTLTAITGNMRFALTENAIEKARRLLKPKETPAEDVSLEDVASELETLIQYGDAAPEAVRTRICDLMVRYPAVAVSCVEKTVRKLQGDDPKQVVMDFFSLGMFEAITFFGRHQYRGTIVFCERILEVLEDFFKDEDELRENSNSILDTQVLLAMAYQGLGEAERAIELYQKMLDSPFVQRFENVTMFFNMPLGILLRGNLADVYNAQGEYQKAIDLYREVIGQAERGPRDTRYIILPLSRLAAIHEVLGESEKATRIYRELVEKLVPLLRTIFEQRVELDISSAEEVRPRLEEIDRLSARIYSTEELDLRAVGQLMQLFGNLFKPEPQTRTT